VQFEIKDKAMTELSVSILSADLANLAAETADSMVCGADMVHFDVMDGHFVPNITYGAPVLKCLKKAVPEAFYDVHLMISDPARYAQDFATAGANLINFHIEAVPNHVGQTIAAVRETGCLVGLTISPSTPPQAVFPYLDELDLTYTQYITMMVMWEHKEMNVKELGEHLYLDSGTLTPVLKKLEQKGWVKRNRAKEDERVLIVTLTAEGEKLRDKAVEIPQKVGGCVCLDQEEAASLYKILYKILGNM